MAKIKLGELVDDITGKVRNHIYTHCKDRNILKTNPAYIGNPKTFVQQPRYRQYFSELKPIWYNTLTQAQRDAWEVFSEAQESGYNSFYRCNMNLRSISYPPPTYSVLIAAPAGIAGPTAPTKQRFFYDSSQQKLYIYFTYPIGWGDFRPGEPEFGRVRLWMRGLGHIYKRIQTTKTGPKDTEDVLEVQFFNEYDQAQVLTPGTYDVWLDAISSYGLKSDPSEVNRTYVPQPGATGFLGLWNNDIWNELKWGG